jgi:hypothetical protein
MELRVIKAQVFVIVFLDGLEMIARIDNVQMINMETHVMKLVSVKKTIQNLAIHTMELANAKKDGQELRVIDHVRS